MRPMDCMHLYEDPRHYDLHNLDLISDIPFHLKLIRRFGEPVLELACGTGRITIPVAESGYDVTGLDLSPQMLTHAKEKSETRGLHILWIKADCRDFTLKRKFALIIFPFNSIVHLHDLDSIEACFKCVRDHLKEGGRFVIDVFNPSMDILTRNPEERFPVTQYQDPDGRGTITVTESNTYDAAAQMNRVKWHYDIGDGADIFTRDLNVRIFYPKELLALLRYNGFTMEERYGNYNFSDFGSDSPKQLIVCKVN